LGMQRLLPDEVTAKLCSLWATQARTYTVLLYSLYCYCCTTQVLCSEL
jgi:hypothetical protein